MTRRRTGPYHEADTARHAAWARSDWDRLLKDLLPPVIGHAIVQHRARYRIPPDADHDMQSAANEAAWRACLDWKPEGGASLATFVRRYVRQALWDEYRPLVEGGDYLDRYGRILDPAPPAGNGDGRGDDEKPTHGEGPESPSVGDYGSQSSDMDGYGAIAPYRDGDSFDRFRQVARGWGDDPARIIEAFEAWQRKPDRGEGLQRSGVADWRRYREIAFAKGAGARVDPTAPKVIAEPAYRPGVNALWVDMEAAIIEPRRTHRKTPEQKRRQAAREKAKRAAKGAKRGRPKKDTSPYNQSDPFTSRRNDK